tara:strand:- start:1388 stop:1729 length:342 start_codon:yes stop_codon:yes gene_type:complete
MEPKKNSSPSLKKNRKEYILKPSKFFLEQLSNLSNESKRVIEDKLRLAKYNPFRFKRIEGYNTNLFRIRFEDNRKEKRIIYFVDKEEIKLICITERDKKYKDLKRYLKNLGYK